MKYLICTLLTLTAFITNAQIKKAEIIATGLTCSMCSNAINKQLKSISAVDSIQIDLNNNKFTVYLKEDNDLNPYSLKSKVEKAGFFVGDMTIYFDYTDKIMKNYISLDGTPFKSSASKAKVLDKGYTTAKAFKKIVKKYQLSSLSTDNEEDFHLLIL